MPIKKRLLASLFAVSSMILSSCVQSDPNGPTSPAEGALELLAPGSADASAQAPSVSFAVNDGVVSYQAVYGGAVVSEGDRLGIVTSLGDYSQNLSLASDPVHSSGVSEYDLLGKKSHVRADYNQIDLKFSSSASSDFFLTVQARAYAEGVGIRLGLEKASTSSPSTFGIEDELFSFTMPMEADYIYQETNFNSTLSSEAAWKMKRSSAGDVGELNMPLMYQYAQDRYALISEANVLNGTYHASVLEKQGGRIDVDFTPEAFYKSEYVWNYDTSTWNQGKGEERDPTVNVDITSSNSFYAPWRFLAIGSLSQIADNTLAESLSDAPDPTLFSDTSYIQPGNVTWTWLNGDLRHDQIPREQFRTLGLQIYKNYVDFAAENGWGYQLLDEAWQPHLNDLTEAQKAQYSYYDPSSVEVDADGRPVDRQYLGYYDWTQELLDYAKSRNVKLLVWVPFADLQTDKERQRLDEWSRMGFVGIKPDFFDDSNQKTLAEIHKIVQASAKAKLMVNLHGFSKPTGQRRTYPNVITQEGIGGAENYFFQQMERNQKKVQVDGVWTSVHPRTSDILSGPNQMTLLPFVRFAVGPGDYTPTASFGAPEGAVVPGSDASPSSWTRTYDKFENPPVFTLAALFAGSVISESPLQTMADKPFAYRASPSAQQNFFKAIPAAYDESRVEGIPGKVVEVARRKGEEWWIGVASSYDHYDTGYQFYQDYSIDLSKYLQPGSTYRAYIYSDNEDQTALLTSLSQENMFKPAEYTKGLKIQEIDVSSSTSVPIKMASVPTPRYTKVKSNGQMAFSSPELTTNGGAAIRIVKVS